jgi:hypothetical protein
MNKILIFANCQGTAIGKMLKYAGYDDIHTYHNYTYITHDALDNNIKYDLETCDIFIYQPLSETYKIYNTNNLKKYLKNSCISISFPYIFNDAFIPLYISYKWDIPVNGEYNLNGDKIKYGNVNTIKKYKDLGYSLETIIDLYNKNMIDFDYENRFNNSISILENKELHTDIKISKFIKENYKKFRLFNYHQNNSDHDITFCNHP